MARACQRCGHDNQLEAKFCLSCGAMLDLADTSPQQDPFIGKVLLGRYRPVRLLGEGGMGRVYLAEQKMGAATRKVAIKTLHPELSTDAQLVSRFLRESETVIQLTHPNTIQFYDFGELEDKTLFIVMEYIEGRSLSLEMEKGLLDLGRIDLILGQVCGSLYEAHQRGIVHRDLKPDNVLLTQRGGHSDFVKVLDFGIAKSGEAEDQKRTKLTKQGTVLGTPPYMSPEQFKGMGLDSRSDIYSLAVMVYEMMTGVLPFQANSPWEWATKHLTEAPAPFTSHVNGMRVPPFKQAAVLRALAKEPGARPATVLEFLQEATGIPQGQPSWGGMSASNPSAPAYVSPAYGTAQVGAMGGHNPPSNPHFAPSINSPNSGQGSGQVAAYNSNPGYQQGPYNSPAYGTSAQPSSGGTGKWIVLAGIVGVLLTATVAGAYFVMRGNPPVVAADPPITPPNTPTVPLVDPTIGTTTVPPVAVNPPRQDAAVQVPVVHVDQPNTNDSPNTNNEPHHRPRERGLSAADEERVRQMATRGQTAATRNDWMSAVANLREMQNLAGRQHPSVVALRQFTETRSQNLVGQLIMQRRCGAAQDLYRQLQAGGVAGPSRRHFSPDDCALP